MFLCSAHPFILCSCCKQIVYRFIASCFSSHLGILLTRPSLPNPFHITPSTLLHFCNRMRSVIVVNSFFAYYKMAIVWAYFQFLLLLFSIILYPFILLSFGLFVSGFCNLSFALDFWYFYYPPTRPDDFVFVFCESDASGGKTKCELNFWFN